MRLCVCRCSYVHLRFFSSLSCTPIVVPAFLSSIGRGNSFILLLIARILYPPRRYKHDHSLKQHPRPARSVVDLRRTGYRIFRCLWTVISDKLVGTMLRARKRGLIEFEGEMLFQRRDDHVIVSLVKNMDEINEMFSYTGPRMKLGHVRKHIESDLPPQLLD
ncbi:actin-binding Rho-activating protein-like [Tropilaelaps mercedesae]|uniref:Actin-binding Rho-activating protein-like n=1 Tax=Tropilaelaps mercedesae TaxID=418985 RepID=A0A1V9WYE8_9ACAR|nr:actin-binding Rho-activating protein-like [Tropilaelaps mercedesae]